MTFSIVARDPQAGEWGVAVQSRFMAIGALTPWARAGVGAIATQAWINTVYGSRGLALLTSGLTAAETLARLTKEDEGRTHRQVGIIGVSGTPAIYTGKNCPPWAGGLVGAHYACQGNFLVGQETIQAMAQAFEKTVGLCGIALWHRFLRGRQQAAISAGSNRQHYWWYASMADSGDLMID